MVEPLVKQLQTKRLIERSLDNFKKIGKSNLTAGKIRSRIVLLKDNWQQFLEGHSILLRVVPEPTRASIEYFKDGFFETTQEIYETTHDFMTDWLEEVEPPALNNSASDLSHIRHTPSAFSLSHLPSIQLPPFDGSYDEWEQFRDRFTTLILENKELNDFARMHFLTSCVTGRARECIGKLAVTSTNFEIAWKTLTLRYDNKRRLLTQHLSALLNLSSVSRESVRELQALQDKVNISVASLLALERTPQDLWNDVLVHIIVSKLDPVTHKAWNMKSSESRESPSFEDLNTFLTNRTRALEEYASGSTAKSNAKSPSFTKVHVATTVARSVSSCPICTSRHYFSEYPNFVRGNPTHRRELVRQHRRCFNCLSQNHSVSECKSKYSCRTCHQRHHSMLHTSSETSANQTTSASPPNMSRPADLPKTEIQTLHTSADPREKFDVLLPTVWVNVRASSGRSVTVRSLLDQGSQSSFISENLAQLLHAKRIRMSTSLSVIGGIPVGTARHAALIYVSPPNSLSPSYSTTAVILSTLTSYAPKHVANLAEFPYLSDLSLADPDPTSSDPIHLIIGAELYNEVLLDGRRKGTHQEPTAQNSIFGWFLSGPLSMQPGMQFDSSDSKRAALSISVNHCFVSPSLEDEIKRFWEVEELPQRSFPTLEDEQCEEHFRSTHTRADDGRYIVRLPFKTGLPIKIGSSRQQAERQLIALKRRLRGNSALATEYESFLTEYEILGHMRKAPPISSLHEPSVYIPHHSVLREDSSTTHLRVVFNASSITSNGTSLNDHLCSGPKLQTDLPSVLMQWRQFKFVYTTDITIMYRQIRIDPRDLNYQRILWSSGQSESCAEYQLLTVTYGMTCAPFLALRVLRQLAIDDGSLYPLAISVLRDNIYVDDLLFGDEDPARLIQIRQQVVALLRRGGFEL